jgi:glycosyltransferase involved in cell wall biosynthesis
MKIAFIYDAVYPWIKGGAEKRIYEIAKRLAEKHEVHWFGVGWWFKENGKSEVMERDGIVLHPVCKPMQLYVNGRRSIGEALYFASKLLPKLIKERFDVVDCQEFPYFPCFSAKVHSLLRRSKFVVTWHEVWSDYWFGYLGRKGVFGYLVERLTTKLTKNNVAVSELTKRDLEKLGLKNVEIIPNGIDFEGIQRVRRAEEESDVIFAGRLIRDKNVDVLIRAVRLLKEEIPDIKCVIIGDGPERMRLEKLARDFGLNGSVEFKGFLKEHDDVIALMKSSKVFVLPSTREDFGIVALEANACGLPVVTVEHEMNATKDLIENGRNGFVCRLSAEDIAENVLTALHSDMSNECIEIAKGYDWDVIVRRCERYYGV